MFRGTVSRDGGTVGHFANRCPNSDFPFRIVLIDAARLFQLYKMLLRMSEKHMTSSMTSRVNMRVNIWCTFGAPMTT
jgi:hypothetical protein